MNKNTLAKIRSDHEWYEKNKHIDAGGYKVVSARIKPPLLEHVQRALDEAKISPSELVLFALSEYLGVSIEQVVKQ